MPFDRWRKRGLKMHIPKVFSFGLPGRLSPKCLFLLSQVQLHHQKKDGQEPGNPPLSSTVPVLGLWGWTSINGPRQVSRKQPPVHTCTPGKRSLLMVSAILWDHRTGTCMCCLLGGQWCVCSWGFLQLTGQAAQGQGDTLLLPRKQRLTEPQGRSYFLISGMDLSFHNVKSQRIHCDV